MKKHILLFVAFVSMTFSPLFASTVLGQDEKSSRRESAAIEAIEKIGGRVYRISASDSSREVSFYLAGEPVTDEQITDLSAVNEVIWLNLAGSKITATGLKQIEGMKLKKLHLEKSAIKDDALDVVKEQKELEYLNLYSTAVTDKGLEKLSGMKSLKKLYLWQTKTTEEGIKKLQEKLPDLKIVGECKLVPVPPAESKADKKKKAEKKKKEAETKANKEKDGDKKEAGKKEDAKKPETKKK